MSLAPLSKAERLKHLDLSNDFYDIDLSQLLRATCDLPQLSFLSLPQGALKRAYISAKEVHRWPRNLVHLQLNGMPPDSLDRWNNLITDLPDHLRILGLCFRKGIGSVVLERLWWLKSSAEQITSLNVPRVPYWNPATSWLFKPFPNLKSISLPYHRSILNLHDPDGIVPAALENLYLLDTYVHDYTDEPDAPDKTITTEELATVASRFPMLKHMELPPRYHPELHNERDIADIEALQKNFVERWPSESPADVGVFLGDSLVDDEPPWIKNTWGARSRKKAY